MVASSRMLIQWGMIVLTLHFQFIEGHDTSVPRALRSRLPGPLYPGAPEAIVQSRLVADRRSSMAVDSLRWSLCRGVKVQTVFPKTTRCKIAGITIVFVAKHRVVVVYCYQDFQSTCFFIPVRST